MGNLLKERLEATKRPVHGEEEAEAAAKQAAAADLSEDDDHEGGENGRDAKLREAADAKLSEAAEECIVVDMDFSENYDIVHKVEIQSEHWSHQQVTLFIVITHFKSGGKWTSEAHVFVSGDRGHDTFFVQHAMDGTLLFLLTPLSCPCLKFNT
jgi:hypothetical protein